jgi:beta-glucanase (GH16 family)
MSTLKLFTKYSTRIILVLFVLFLVGFFVMIQSTRIDLTSLSLLINEEFQGSDLNAHWETMGDGAFYYTGFYSDEQLAVNDGQVVITLSRKDGINGNQLYSSAFRSAQTYTSGYFEVTAILPKISDFNAVIALTNEEALTNTDPSQGAKVVFASSLNQPYPLLSTGIYYENGGEATETQNAFVPSAIYNEPHRFGILWDEDSYSFYFDGYRLWESTKTAVSTKPLYLSVGFEFPYYTTQDITTLNQSFVIDSIRIYKIKP